MMKRASKIVLGALALSLVPFEWKKGEDGSFSYKSCLLGVSGSKEESGKQRLTISLFNLPNCLKKKPAASEKAAEEVTEVTAEATPEEAAATSDNAPEAAQ